MSARTERLVVLDEVPCVELVAGDRHLIAVSVAVGVDADWLLKQHLEGGARRRILPAILQ